MLSLARIEINGFEEYSSKKYKDVFIGKPNPLKTVGHCIAYFTNDTCIELTLKFVEIEVSNEKVINKANLFLKRVGLIQ